MIFVSRGITVLVITVAPQNDICPHGSTYPINAVTITLVTDQLNAPILDL